MIALSFFALSRGGGGSITETYIYIFCVVSVPPFSFPQAVTPPSQSRIQNIDCPKWLSCPAKILSTKNS